MAKTVKKTSKTKAAKKTTATKKKTSTKGATVKKTATKKSSAKKSVVSKPTTAKKAVKKSVKKAAKKAVKKTSKKSALIKAAVKKTISKKTRVKKVVKKTRSRRAASNKHLTKSDLKKFRILLMAKLSELTGDVVHIENGALRSSRLDAAGDLSSMPIHMADMGTDNFEQEFALGLMDSERKLLRKIYDALKRMDKGVYGICEGTDKPISKARLEASPWSRYCIEYARMVEKGLVIEGDKIYDELDEDIFEDDDEDEIGEDKDEYSAFALPAEDDEDF